MLAGRLIVVRLVPVNLTVEFNHQRGLVAVEVDDIGLDDLLAAKVPAVQPAGAEPLPEFALSRGQRPARFLGADRFFAGDELAADDGCLWWHERTYPLTPFLKERGIIQVAGG